MTGVPDYFVWGHLISSCGSFANSIDRTRARTGVCSTAIRARTFKRPSMMTSSTSWRTTCIGISAGLGGPSEAGPLHDAARHSFLR